MHLVYNPDEDPVLVQLLAWVTSQHMKWNEHMPKLTSIKALS